MVGKKPLTCAVGSVIKFGRKRKLFSVSRRGLRWEVRCHSSHGSNSDLVSFRRVGASPRHGREDGVYWQTLLSSPTKVSS